MPQTHNRKYKVSIDGVYLILMVGLPYWSIDYEI